MPGEDVLPAPLARLARRNAIEISDSRWQFDVERLIEALEEVLERQPTQAQPKPSDGASSPPERGLSCEKGLKHRPLTKQQIPEFLAALERLRERNPRHYSHRIGPMFPLAFETGLRPEEYLGLTLDAVNLDGEYPYISVRRVAVRHPQVKGEWWFAEPKTVRSRRLVPITKELAGLLRDHIRRTERRKRKVREWKENRLLFPNAVGEPHYLHRLRDVFKEVIAEMGLDPQAYRLYGTRHAMATAALTERIHPKVVAERLGHSSVATTLDIYSDVAPTMQDEATDKLGGIIYGRKPKEDAPVPDVDMEDYELPF